MILCLTYYDTFFLGGNHLSSLFKQNDILSAEELFVKVNDQISPHPPMNWIVQVERTNLIWQADFVSLPSPFCRIFLDTGHLEGILCKIELMRSWWFWVISTHVSQESTWLLPILQGKGNRFSYWFAIVSGLFKMGVYILRGHHHLKKDQQILPHNQTIGPPSKAWQQVFANTQVGQLLLKYSKFWTCKKTSNDMRGKPFQHMSRKESSWWGPHSLHTPIPAAGFAAPPRASLGPSTTELSLGLLREPLNRGVPIGQVYVHWIRLWWTFT